MSRGEHYKRLTDPEVEGSFLVISVTSHQFDTLFSKGRLRLHRKAAKMFEDTNIVRVTSQATSFQVALCIVKSIEYDDDTKISGWVTLVVGQTIDTTSSPLDEHGPAGRLIGREK